jgi:hypothetical protein
MQKVSDMMRAVAKQLAPRWIDGAGSGFWSWPSKVTMAYQAGYLAGYADAIDAKADDAALGEK